MNFLDVVIVVLCLGFAVFGIFQGVVRQLFSWGGLLLGHIAGVKFYATAQVQLRLDFPHGDVVGYLLTFLGVYLIVRLVGLIVERWVRSSELSGTDRAAGMLAGFVKGALFSVLLVFVLVIILPRGTAFVRESRLAPSAMAAARWAQKVFPEEIRRAYREKVGEIPSLPAGKDVPAPPLQPKTRPEK